MQDKVRAIQINVVDSPGLAKWLEELANGFATMRYVADGIGIIYSGDRGNPQIYFEPIFAANLTIFDKNEPLTLAPEKPKTPRKRATATQVPELFPITDEMREWAATNKLRVDLDAETAQFLDHFKGTGGRKIDWLATWRLWMRRSTSFAPRGSHATVKRSDGLSTNPFFRMMQEEGYTNGESTMDTTHGDTSLSGDRPRTLGPSPKDIRSRERSSGMDDDAGW
jgi:hypothetical protein